MKILIAGSGDFCEALAARLVREKHEAYVILGTPSVQEGRRNAPSLPDGCTVYDFALDDDKLDFVFASVKPDTMVFLGTADDCYRWESSQNQKTASSYLSGLSNLLCLADRHDLTRFVYLSSTEVYADTGAASVDENTPVRPSDIKGIAIRQGEQMCAAFDEARRLRSVVLRLDNLYGMPGGRFNDFATNMIRAALDSDIDHPFLPPEDVIFTPIYISDAVDATYKALTFTEGGTGIYNLSGCTSSTVYAYKRICTLAGILPRVEEREDEALPSVRKTDCAMFSAKYSYRPIVESGVGLARTFRAFNKRESGAKKVEEKKKNSGRGMLHYFTPMLENLLLFAAMASLYFITSSDSLLSQLDFLLLYVVIIAVTFGLFQASAAVLLACTAMLWAEMQGGTSVFEMVTNLEIVLRMLQLFIVGVICGHMKDRSRVRLTERDRLLADRVAELETIYSINERNTQIKQLLDNRITNYENSLAKIYTVTDRLNSLRSDQVFFSAVGAVADIMDSKDVCIYLVSDNATQMCRLVARSPLSTRALRKSIPFADFGEMGDVLMRDEVYVNRSMLPDLPIMAAPVFSGRKLVSIIMLWSVQFEQLTTYQINNLLVMSKLISSIIDKAITYTRDMESITRHRDGVLRPDFFREVLDVHRQAEKDGVASYQVFRILMDYTDIETVVSTMKPTLRETDYLGIGDDGELYVLLTNTNRTDAQFFVDRQIKAGIHLEEHPL